MWLYSRGYVVIQTLCFVVVVRVSCLDYNQYGELLQMAASPDGQQLALLIKTRKERFVWLMHFRLQRVIMLRHASCDRFVVSPDWEHFVTEGAFLCGPSVSVGGASGGGADASEMIEEVKLWRIYDGMAHELTTFEHASRAEFSRDSRQLFFIEKNACIEIFDLTNQRGVGSLLGDADFIQTVPKMPDCLLSTKRNMSSPRPARR